MAANGHRGGSSGGRRQGTCTRGQHASRLVTAMMCAVNNRRSPLVHSKRWTATAQSTGWLVTSAAKGLLTLLLALSAEPCTAADSDPAHVSGDCTKPISWPDGIVPYDVSKLEEGPRTTVRQAMQRWMDTGARIAFVPRSSQTAYLSFTGRTDAGNNTSQTGF